MSRLLLTLLAAGLVACPSGKSEPARVVAPEKAAPIHADQQPIVEALRAAETAAIEQAEPPCSRPVHVYEGGVDVASDRYTHLVKEKDEYVEAPIDELDRVVTRRRNVPFTLTYPFEKPFTGTINGPLTRRNVIDAIRAGFRAMYQGAEIKEIPGMMNKDVAGKYGRSFHDIGDLVIEQVDLCAEGHLDVSIGS